MMENEDVVKNKRVSTLELFLIEETINKQYVGIFT